MHRGRRLALALAFVALVSGAGACGGDDGAEGGSGNASLHEGPQDGPAPAATVTLKNLRFVPDEVTVKAGETVLWKWDDGGVQHDVKGDGFGSKLKTKGTFRHVFDEAGSYDYVCTVHPTTMKSKVVVT
ncbi:MAG TPA: plastocyanin/azurin family copper-binding protein [Acidimicrobiales bacterium]